MGIECCGDEREDGVEGEDGMLIRRGRAAGEAMVFRDAFRSNGSVLA